MQCFSSRAQVPVAVVQMIGGLVFCLAILKTLILVYPSYGRSVSLDEFGYDRLVVSLNSRLFRDGNLMFGDRAMAPYSRSLGACSDLAFVRLLQWDPAAAVYLTPGADALPGVALVDDDGNGSVDDPSELGATGSDDRVVAPEQTLVTEPLPAVSSAPGESARVVSRGAMVPVWSSDSDRSLQDAIEQLPAPAEMRLDLVDTQGKLHSRFITLH